MADSAHQQAALPEQEREFRKLIAMVGGKERIYLVSDHCDVKEPDGGDADILQELVGELFPSQSGHGDAAGANQTADSEEPRAAPPGGSDPGARLEGGGGDKDGGAARNGHAQRTATRRADVYSVKRAIDSPVIIFVFRQTFISKSPDQLGLKEILKDVRARTKRARSARPALIGLVRSNQETPGTRQCAQVLEQLMRSVFHKHPPETVWVGCFTPNTESHVLSIKKNACKVICSSQTADNSRDRGNPLFWPLQCLFWRRRRGARCQANNSSSRDRDESGSIEESVPLKTKPTSAGPPVDGQSAAGDG